MIVEVLWSAFQPLFAGAMSSVLASVGGSDLVKAPVTAFFTSYNSANVGLPISEFLTLSTLVLSLKLASIGWHLTKETIKWIPIVGSGGE